MMKYLHKLGKAFNAPVAALPVCGIPMGIVTLWLPAVMVAEGLTSGAAYTVGFLLIGTAAPRSTTWHGCSPSALPSVCLDDHDGTAGLAGLVSFLMMQQLLSPGVVGAIRAAVDSTLEEGTVDYIAFSKIAGNSFIGILAAVIGAACYNKFKNTQLPDWLAFFSGKRSVAIVTAACFYRGFRCSAVRLARHLRRSGCPSATALPRWTASAPASTLSLNRLLIPTGLHHALNNVFCSTPSVWAT